MAVEPEYSAGKQKPHLQRRWVKHSYLYIALLIICFFWLGVYVATVYVSHHFSQGCRSSQSEDSTASTVQMAPSTTSAYGIANKVAKAVLVEDLFAEGQKVETTPHEEQQELPTTEEPLDDDDKNIIVLYGPQTWGEYDTWNAKMWSKCPKKNCRITTNTNFIDKSSAVVFNAVTMPAEILLKPLLEQKSKSHSKFVFLSGLTPAETFFNPETYNGFFDLTMTYKSNSDIRIPYWPNNGILPTMLRPKKPGRILTEEEKGSLKESNKNYFPREGKDGFMAIILDNCDPKHMANIYNMRLRWEGDISVLSRQKCNATKMGFPMIENFPCQDLYSDSCSKFMEGFKFVVLPEKNICVDYMHRAYWYSLKAWEAVPILWGSDNVKDQTIPGSFINTLDHLYISPVFKEALKSKTDSRQFSTYMNWKHEDRLEEFYWQCELCEKINSAKPEKDKKQKFSEFWNKEANCGESTTIYKASREQLRRTGAIP